MFKYIFLIVMLHQINQCKIKNFIFEFLPYSFFFYKSLVRKEKIIKFGKKIATEHIKNSILQLVNEKDKIFYKDSSIF